jgi:hypothetical protein
MNVATAITLALSLYGAGLATRVARQQSQANKPRLVLRAGPHVTLDAANKIRVDIRIVAVNAGARPIKVDALGFDKNGKVAVVAPRLETIPEIPKLLTTGDEAELIFKLDRLRQAVANGEITHIRAQDNEERIYREPLPESLLLMLSGQ